MVKKSPQKTLFEEAGKKYKCYIIPVYLAAVFSFISGLISTTDCCIKWIVSLNCNILKPLSGITAVIAFVGKFLFERTYREAENMRRDGFIDNAFSCAAADIISEGYYDNEDVPYGIRKALSNIHENCFFSYAIIHRMEKRSGLKLFIILITIISMICFGIAGTSTILLLFNLLISLCLFEDVLNLVWLRKDLDLVNTRCKDIWDALNTKRNRNTNNKVLGKIIREIVRYETSLAYASTMFSKDIYSKINAEKTKEWEEMKKRYKMSGTEK